MNKHRNIKQSNKNTSGISGINIALITFVIIVIVGIFAFAANTNNTTASKAALSNNSIVTDRLSHTILAGNNDTWQPNYTNLSDAMAALNLPGLSDTVFHHHAHLDIYIHGAHIVIPSQIGFSGNTGSPLHTHDTSGVMHIESDDGGFKPLLGYFFDMWGVSLTSTNIGGYKTDSTNTLSAYVNGNIYKGDLLKIPLNQHDEIVLVYRNQAQAPNPIPARYQFQSGE